MQLHCVPSNITTRIKQLEEELGAPLFYREGKSLNLTPSGEIFLDYCHKILGYAMKRNEVFILMHHPLAH